MIKKSFVLANLFASGFLLASCGLKNSFDYLNYDFKPVKYTNYNPQRNPDFFDCQVYFKTSNNQIIIGTSTGAYISVDNGINFKQFLNNYSINAIKEDEDSNIWIAGDNILFKTEDLNNFEEMYAAPDTIYDINFDLEKYNLFLLSGNGYVEYSSDAARSFNESHFNNKLEIWSPVKGDILKTVITASGEVYVGMYDYNHETETTSEHFFWSSENGGKDFSVVSGLALDSNNENNRIMRLISTGEDTYIAFKQKGVVKLQDETKEVVKVYSTDKLKGVLDDIALDENGNLYVAINKVDIFVTSLINEQFIGLNQNILAAYRLIFQVQADKEMDLILNTNKQKQTDNNWYSVYQWTDEKDNLNNQTRKLIFIIVLSVIVFLILSISTILFTYNYRKKHNKY